MPVPIWLIPVALKGAAAVAGAAGISTAAHGVKKMKDANDTMEAAKSRHERNMGKFEKENKTTSKDMDKLGTLELEILRSFSEFSDVFEKIKNRPTFENYSKNGVTLPKYDGEKLKEVSVGAGVLLGGLGGAGLGAAGGFAAAGATTAATMALGTASTGTAIASLSGAAATNATLALLGGGTLAMGGGGMAAGAAALGAATLGVGLLVGGIIFNFTGGKLSDKADEAWSQMKKAEDQINKICDYLVKLRETSNKYYGTLTSVNSIYQGHLSDLESIVNTLGHTDWNTFTLDEKRLTENTVLLVGLLYNMCKVEIVLKVESDNDINKINTVDVEESINNADSIIGTLYGQKKDTLSNAQKDILTEWKNVKKYYGQNSSSKEYRKKLIEMVDKFIESIDPQKNYQAEYNDLAKAIVKCIDDLEKDGINDQAELGNLKQRYFSLCKKRSCL